VFILSEVHDANILFDGAYEDCMCFNETFKCLQCWL